MRFTYHTEQRVPHPVGRVFDFFANPANLPLLMPAWQRSRIERQSLVAPPPRPGTNSTTHPVAGAGSHITLSFRPLPGLPFRMSWDAEIAEFVWNEHFCDTQMRGPFVYWRHCHSIHPVGSESTLVVDDVDYELPFGPAGVLGHRLFLRRQIEQTFAFRQRRLVHLLARVHSAP